MPADRMTFIQNRQPFTSEPHDGVVLARSLWHEPVWNSVETLGIGGEGVPISTRWMI